MLFVIENLLRFVLLILFTYTVLSQILIPAVKGERPFPWFNKKRNSFRNEALSARTDIHDLDVRIQLASLQDHLRAKEEELAAATKKPLADVTPEVVTLVTNESVPQPEKGEENGV